VLAQDGATECAQEATPEGEAFMTWAGLHAAAVVFLLLAYVSAWLWPAEWTPDEDVDWTSETMKKWRAYRRRGLN
jgi:hypothetical protein